MTRPSHGSDEHHPKSNAKKTIVEVMQGAGDVKLLPPSRQRRQKYHGRPSIQTRENGSLGCDCQAATRCSHIYIRLRSGNPHGMEARQLLILKGFNKGRLANYKPNARRDQ